jgi:hypothetical protein
MSPIGAGAMSSEAPSCTCLVVEYARVGPDLDDPDGLAVHDPDRDLAPLDPALDDPATRGDRGERRGERRLVAHDVQADAASLVVGLQDELRAQAAHDVRAAGLEAASKTRPSAIGTPFSATVLFVNSLSIVSALAKASEPA